MKTLKTLKLKVKIRRDKILWSRSVIGTEDSSEDIMLMIKTSICKEKALYKGLNFE